MDTTNNQTTQAIPLNQDSSPEAVIELLFKLKVKDVMTTDVVTVTPGQTLRSAQQIMKEHHITGVPVVVGKNLAGLVIFLSQVSSIVPVSNALTILSIDTSPARFLPTTTGTPVM